MTSSYKETLNLPETSFAMKANLAQREPNLLAHWESIHLYEKIRKKFAGKEQFILHDGPPYANGEIHLGHALNKILKDIIVKSKTLSGFDAPYVPGWDCHGLPIEINVEKKVGKVGTKINAKAFRAACREYAPKQIEGQKKDFMRLGVLADWKTPYLTMNYSYEANIIRTLGAMIANKHVYRGLKPVNWCYDCGSALAEAEVEYANKTSSAIDVRFDFSAQDKVINAFNISAEQITGAIAVVIWTTTPWTLPANLAVALHPDIEYSLLRCTLLINDSEQTACIIVAKDLIEQTMSRYNCTVFEELAQCQGKALEHLQVMHPWIKRQVPIILADHVTIESGTGAVHTAPGHGVDDYRVGQQYQLDTLNPVDARGVFKANVEHFAGQHVIKANADIVALLNSTGRLLAHQTIEHSYPHCWRHKSPILFRATSQWFVGMRENKLLEKSLQEISNVNWLPERGQARITAMMSERPDWCISRQRSWGVPITVFYHKVSGEIHPRTLALLEQVAQSVEREGVDAWFDLDTHSLLGEEANEYEKATDILDVWFDSGASHACVLDVREGLRSPADLYLEGSDQHRGWFQSSLLIGVATNQHAPFTNVLTHGFTVDAQGKKMSKSARNGVAPQKLMQQMGADVLRLWVASTDYRDDVTVSDEVFKRTADSYRRIRNTARFLLSNLTGFDPQQDLLQFDDLLALDKWAVSRAAQLQQAIIQAYDDYQFHVVYQKIHHFCVNELGGFYLSIIKDRVYTMPAKSVGRRSAQTAMYHIIEALVRWVAPIISFTADEIWQAMMGERDESVHLAQWYDALQSLSDNELMGHDYWGFIQEVKQAVNKEIEEARNNGQVKSELSTELSLYCDADIKQKLAWLGDEIKFVLLSSNVKLCEISEADAADAQQTEIAGLKVSVATARDNKCTRCWHHDASVGENTDHPELCSRCTVNINEVGEMRQYA